MDATIATNLRLNIRVLAAAISHQTGIQLIEDPNAKVFAFSPSNKVLAMPSLEQLAVRYPDPKDLTVYVKGAIYHEVGHALFSDSVLLDSFYALYEGQEHYDLACDIGRVLDDVVIERQQCKAMPSSGPALLALWELVFDQTSAQMFGKVSAIESLYRCIFLRSRHSALGQSWSKQFAEAALDSVHSDVTQKMKTTVEQLLDEVDYLNDTESAVKLAVKLLERMGILPVTPIEKETAAGESREPSQQPSGEQPGGEGEPQESGNGQTANAEQPAESVQGDGNGSDGTDAIPNDCAQATAMSEVVGSEKEGSTEVAMILGHVPGEALANSSLCLAAPTEGALLRERILVSSMYASERLSTLLKAQHHAKTTFTKSGVIVPTRLWKLRTGNARVFKRTVEAKTYSTAIKLLLDRSSSMERMMQRALEVALMLPIALENVRGIQTSVDVFPGDVSACQTLVPFGTRAETCLDEIAGVDANGGTPMIQAIQLAVDNLLSVNVDRHLLVVITDGEPSCKSTAAQLVAGIERTGVEVYGIGIGHGTAGAMKRIFSDWCVVASVDEVADKLYSLMELKMVEDRIAA